MIGTILGKRYQIDAKLFTDKMGSTFKGRRLPDGLSVHVLVLDKGIAPSDAQISSIMDVSARLAQLRHPCLLPTIDWVREGTGPTCLITPAMDAVPLAEFAKGGSVLPDTVDLVHQITGALQAASELGLAVRDLSAHNTFVSVLPDGGQVARITRWGYHELLPEYSLATKDGNYYGTPEYMAPEVCSGKSWCPQSDLYSLGILAYHLVTGKAPFISSNPATTLKRQIYEKPLPLHLLKRGVAHISDFEKIILKTLQKMPTKRPQSFAEVVSDISAFRDSTLPTLEFTVLREQVWPDITSTGVTEAGSLSAALPDAPEKPDTLTFSAPTGVAAAEGVPGSLALDDIESADTLRMDEADSAEVRELEEDRISLEVTQPMAHTSIPDAVSSAPPAQARPMDSAAAPAGPADKASVDDGRAKFLAEAKRQLEETDDSDWYVASAQDLEAREITHLQESWAKKEGHSGWKFYIAVGAIGLVLLVGIGLLLARKADRTQVRGTRTEAQVAAEKREREAGRLQHEKEQQEISKARSETEARRLAVEQATAEEKLKREAQETKAKEEAERLKFKQEHEQVLREQVAAREQEMAIREAKTLATLKATLLREMDTYGTPLAGKLKEWTDGQVPKGVEEVQTLVLEGERIRSLLSEVSVDESGANVRIAQASLTALEQRVDEYRLKVKTTLDRTAESFAEVEAVQPEGTDAATSDQQQQDAAREEARRIEAEQKAQAEKAAQEEKARAAAEEARRKEQEAAKKKETVPLSPEDLAERKAQEQARKAAQEEKKKEQEEARKKAQEEAKAKALEAKKAQELAKKTGSEQTSGQEAAEQRSMLLQGQGTRALKDSKYDEAVSLFEQARQADPTRAAMLDRLIKKAKDEKAAAARTAPQEEKKVPAETDAKKSAEAERKAQQEAAKKQAAADEKAAKEEAARKKAEEQAEKKKAEEDKRTKAEEDARKKEEGQGKAADEAKAKRFQTLGMGAMKQENYALAIRYFEQARKLTDDTATLDRLIERCKEKIE
jgi:serine/threonine protein kinase